MMNAIIHTRLLDGQPICIRTIRPADEALMRDGIAQLSAHSRYLRFFSGQSIPADRVIHKLLDVDGHDHLAWGAIRTAGADHPAIGAVHAFRDAAASAAGEYSVAILDAYHGLGLGRMLTAVLLIHCRLENICTLDVQILSENGAAAGFVRSLGGQRTGISSDISDFTLDTEQALRKLRARPRQGGLHDLFAQLADYLP